MNQSYFDTIILGDSLGARIAAALLARSGLRLLTLRPAGYTPTSAWCFSSLLLERILDRLDGRAVLTKPPRFQYLSDGIRLDFHGRNPFSDEVRRECPRHSEEILTVTTDLSGFGEKLAELLWACGGLPLAGIKSRGAFLWRGLRRGMTPSRLNEPLAERLAQLDSPAAATILGALLPALALSSGEDLTLAEAALVWHGLMRSTAASAAGLDQLLNRRYQQFHGEEEDLARLESLTPGQRQPSRLRLKGGQTVATGCLVIADPAVTPHLPEGLRPATALPPRALPIPVTGSASPILADQVILAGSPPLRLSFSGPEEQRRVLVECTQEVSAAELRSRLQALCPFAAFGDDLAATVATTSARSGLRAAMRRATGATGLFHCSSTVLPGLGSVGETLLGLSVATAVRQRLKVTAAQ